MSLKDLAFTPLKDEEEEWNGFLSNNEEEERVNKSRQLSCRWLDSTEGGLQEKPTWLELLPAIVMSTEQ